jgi:signal transduction histidine kinase
MILLVGLAKAQNNREQSTASRVENSFRQHTTKVVSILCLALGCISVVIPLLYGLTPWTGVLFTLLAYWTYRLSLKEYTFQYAASILTTILGVSAISYAIIHGVYGALSFFLVLFTGIVATMTLNQPIGIAMFILEGVIIVPLAIFQHLRHHIYMSDSVIGDTLMALFVTLAVVYIIRVLNKQLTQLQAKEHAQSKELAVYNARIEEVLQTKVEALEEEIKDRTKRLRSLAQRGKELSNLTHDASNTLTSLRLTLDQNIHTFPEKDSENIEKSFDYLRTILQDVNKQETLRKHCSILEVINRSHTLLEKQLRSSKIEISLDFPAAEIAMSAAHLQRIIDNLLHNSRDALEEIIKKAKHRMIQITGHTEGNIYVFSIKDTGPGIPPDLISLATEPWFSTKGDEHMGMGLSSVAELLHLYPRTDMHIESKYGSYTKVTLKFPLWHPGKS